MNKKTLHILILILTLSLLLFTSCSKSEMESGDMDDDIDIWNYTPPTSDDPMALCNIFSDPYFALDVATALKKEVTDVVTYEELASYDGELECGPSPLNSIEGIGLLKGMTSFNSSKNDLEVIPSEFGELTVIKTIDLSKSFSIKKLPEEIGDLKNLEYLNLSITELEAVPSGIGGCENLKILYIDNTEIKSLPTEIGDLSNLEFLDIHGNDIDVVPDSICKLTKLQSLDIGQTELKELPQDIGNLKKLIRLDLFGCELKTLPSSIKKLDKLRYLNVYDNYDLDDNYTQWFDAQVYECKDDPEEDEEWMSKWY